MPDFHSRRFTLVLSEATLLKGCLAGMDFDPDAFAFEEDVPPLENATNAPFYTVTHQDFYAQPQPQLASTFTPPAQLLETQSSAYTDGQTSEFPVQHEFSATPRLPTFEFATGGLAASMQPAAAHDEEDAFEDFDETRAHKQTASATYTEQHTTYEPVPASQTALSDAPKLFHALPASSIPVAASPSLMQSLLEPEREHEERISSPIVAPQPASASPPRQAFPSRGVFDLAANITFSPETAEPAIEASAETEPAATEPAQSHTASPANRANPAMEAALDAFLDFADDGDDFGYGGGAAASTGHGNNRPRSGAPQLQPARVGRRLAAAAANTSATTGPGRQLLRIALPPPPQRAHSRAALALPQAPSRPVSDSVLLRAALISQTQTASTTQSAHSATTKHAHRPGSAATTAPNMSTPAARRASRPRSSQSQSSPQSLAQSHLLLPSSVAAASGTAPPSLPARARAVAHTYTRDMDPHRLRRMRADPACPRYDGFNGNAATVHANSNATAHAKTSKGTAHGVAVLQANCKTEPVQLTETAETALVEHVPGSASTALVEANAADSQQQQQQQQQQ